MTKFTYTMFISFICNTFLSVAKIIVGLIGKSSALIADGIHTFSDMTTDLISISDDSVEQSKLNKAINFIMGIVILGLGLSIIYISIRRNIVVPSIWIIIFSLITIIIKFMLSSFVMEKGIQYNNVLLVRNAHESDNDVISSVIVFLGLILMRLSDILPLFKYSDMIVSIIVSMFIIKTGFDVLSHEISNMFGVKETNNDYIKGLENVIKINNNVISIDKIDVLKYGPYYEMKCSITLKDDLSLKTANEVAHNIKSKIKSYYPEMEYIIIKINSDNI